MKYCYSCSNCGHAIEQPTRTAPFRCQQCGGKVTMKRDYRAEATGIGSGVRTSRDRGVSDARAYHEWAERAADAEGL